MAFCAYCGSPVGEVSYRPCAACGNPANGAPRPQMPTGGSNAVTIVIVVVIGAFVVLAIAGILAAIAIPNLLTAMQRSKQKRTMADIRSVASAVEAYAVDTKHYPEASSIEELRPLLEPKYMTRVPSKDGWEHELRYACLPARACETYVLSSAGKDGTFETNDVEQYRGGGTKTFDSDIVYSNGSFLQYPEGVQVQ
jgi:type II secretory pathway pseudopilin PulG